MRQRKNIPKHNIILHSTLVPLNRIRDAAALVPALQRIPPRSIQLVVLVLGNPDVLLSKQSAVTLDTIRRRQ